MKKIWDFIKSKYEIIGYILLSALLFGACFIRVFAFIATIYILVFALLLRDETKVLGLFLFFKCFNDRIFVDTPKGFTLLKLLSRSMEAVIGLIYLVRVVQKKSKINWKILIPILLFFVYIILPVHEWSIGKLYEVVCFFAVLYVVFVDRSELNFKYLMRVFVIGMIISCVFGLFKNASPWLQEILPTYYASGTERFQGLFGHHNKLTTMLVMAISSLLFLVYYHELSLIEFFIEFIILFIFGYLAISRAFILTMAVALCVFAIFYFIKNKTKSLPVLGALLIIVGLIPVIFLNITISCFSRIDEAVFDYYPDSQINEVSHDDVENNNEISNNEASNNDKKSIPYSSGVLQGKTQEQIDKIFAGEVLFDPGRKGLWELYLMDWSSSPKTIFFGRGIARADIGTMVTHNLYISLLWQHGLLGCVLLVIIVACMINWKKIRFKDLKPYLAILILAIPFFIFTLIEHRLNDTVSFMIILSALGFIQRKQNNNEQPVVNDGANISLNNITE